MGDKIVESLSGDAQDAVSEFWQKENSKRAAMTAFKQALTNLTAPTETDGLANKLVIVVDELDRCRPDFALTMLEVMKHFFAVDNVHFVLGVNLEELQNSVKARYGNDTNAAKYLQKFVTVTMPIVGPKVSVGQRSDYLLYFDDVSNQLGFDAIWYSPRLKEYLSMINHHTKVGLRDIERLIALASVVPDKKIEFLADQHVLIGLLVMHIIQPELVEKARQSTLQYSDVEKLFKLEGRQQQPARFSEARLVWRAATKQNSEHRFDPSEKIRWSELFGNADRATIVSDIIANCLDAFVLPQ